MVMRASSKRPRQMIFYACMVITLVMQTSLRSHSAEDKKLSVYTAQKNYTLAVTDEDKTEYTGLFELLDPLGKLTLKVKGGTFRLTLDNVEGEFSEGKKLARIGKTELLLPAKAVVEHGRLLVPLRAVPGILEKYQGRRPELHEAGRRLFVGTAGETFTLEIKRPENSLLLTFPAAVNPAISSENGHVHLVFSKEPITFGADSVAYNDKAITAVNLAEHNGAAEITVTGTVPLVAALGEDGKTIAVSTVPAQVAASPAPATTPPNSTPPPAPSNQQPTAPVTKPQTVLPAGAVRFFVMIDPGHGGTDAGARFSDKLLEKDVTLSIARKLRAELQNRGVPAVLLRDGDNSLTYEQRALATNGQRAGIYFGIHAGVPGTGVRIYTAMLPAIDPKQHEKNKPGPFLPWAAAQRNYLEGSRTLAASLVQALAEAKIASASGSAPQLPLNNIAAPAVAIEVALPSAEAKPEMLNAPKYQQAIAAAAAAAIVDSRGKTGERP